MNRSPEHFPLYIRYLTPKPNVIFDRPLTLPIASQWVPSLSPLARGEGYRSRSRIET